jgi:hypothetical protein
VGEARRHLVQDEVEEPVAVETAVSPFEYPAQAVRMAQSLGIHLPSNRQSTEGVRDFSGDRERN